MKLSKQKKCILMRNEIQIWIDKDKANSLIKRLQETDKRFITLRERGEVINVADVQGIYSPKTIEEYKRRKNGQWKCKHGTWHDRGSDCESENCLSKERKDKISEMEKAIEDCEDCDNGYVRTKGGALARCNCITRNN